MAVSIDVLIKKLQVSINELDSNNFLVPKEQKINNLLASCSDLLKANGYVVKIKPHGFGIFKKSKDLVDHYYRILEYSLGINPVRDEPKDLAIAKAFIDRICSDFNLEFRPAILECVALINIVLERKDEFNFDNGTISSFSIFGQGKMRWVVDKAIRISNSSKYSDERNLYLADKWAKDYLAENGKKLGYS